MFEIVRKNKRITGFIVFMFIALIAVIVYSVGYVSSMDMYLMIPLALIISIITSIGTYYYSDRIVLAVSGARPADDKEFKYIKDNLEGLCIAAGLRTVPRLYIIDDSAPNAFATGRNPENAVICLTTGLLDKLEMYELEGVIAHELGHIKNYDILISTIATVMVGMIALLADWFTRTMFWGRDDDDSGGGRNPFLLIIGILLIVLSPIIAQFMQLALSRNREYLADATAIEFTRNPNGLINALKKISDDKEPLEAANKATANMYIINPFKEREQMTWMQRMFATHPPIEDRINAIQNIH